MDRHHDSDALTAYKHQMIQVYRPGAAQRFPLEESYNDDHEEDDYEDSGELA